jgi:O-antigen/teichoic acid export membrane protein
VSLGTRPSISGLLARGSTLMTAGLVVNGVAAYGFLTASGRALGPERFSIISVLWTTLFLVGYGLFGSFEQELTRQLAIDHAVGRSSTRAVERVSIVAALLFVAVAILGIAFRNPLADQLFGGDTTMVWLLLVGILGLGTAEVARGVFAGTRDYTRYGAWYVIDGLAKAVPALVLAVAAVRSVAPYGVGLVLAAAIATVLTFRPSRGLQRDTRPSAQSEWRPLLKSLTHLTSACFLNSLVVNIGTIAVAVLATPGERAEAGVFLSALVVARVPLFFFAAMQAVLLPRFSHLVATENWPRFRALLQRLAASYAVVVVVGTVLVALIGPTIVRIVFGPDFAVLGGLDLGLLAFSSLVTFAALVINEAQVALHHQHQTAWPWAVGAVAFIVTTAWSSSDLILRVELGLAAAGLVVTAIAAGLLWSEFRAAARHELSGAQ